MADERDRIRAMMGLPPLTTKDPVVVGGTPFGQAAPTPKPVTLAEAKSLGFSSTTGISKVGDTYVFDKSLAPERGGFQSVGVAKPGEVQMTPYYGDVTGAYRLTQEQYAAAGSTGGVMNTGALATAMQENEIKDLMAQGLTREQAIARVSPQYGKYGIPIPPQIQNAINQASQAVVTAQVSGNTQALSIAQAALASAQNAANAYTTSTTEAAKNAAVAAATTAAAEAERVATQREAVGKIVADRFAKYGLATLGTKILDLARQGYTESTITLELQNTDEYKTRFAANIQREKKGLSVLTPAEYLSVEDAYRQTLRAYGLTQFDNDAYVKQFIENDVSPSELSTRVVTAVQRVQNADPAVARTLRDYYGVGDVDMVAYVLDPNQQLTKIQRQVAAAEIGTAARLQGLEAGVSVSEQLAAQGITQAEAQKGYATIADILPTAEKLSSIYGTQLEGYGQAEAEQEVFNTLASAQRKRRALIERETGTFAGRSGMSRTSLTSTTGGQI